MEQSVFQQKVLDGVESLTERQSRLETVTNELELKMCDFRRQALSGPAQGTLGDGGPGGRGEVSTECARHFGALHVAFAQRNGHSLSSSLTAKAEGILGGEVYRSSLTSSDIPLPTGYSREVSELVAAYGAARRLCTVYPMGDGVVKLPRLKTDTVFTLLAQASAVTEKSPQTEWVTFTAEKFGGLVRVPAEINEDSFLQQGAFLARYCARNIARVEDANVFVGTGAASGANGTAKGLQALVVDNSMTVPVAANGGGKTHYSDSTLVNFRQLRAKIETAALGSAKYALHPSWESHLNNFNSAGDRPYLAAGLRGASIDGYEIEWVDVLPAYSTDVNASSVFALFGDFKYMYLATRGGISVATSVDAGFATDEILVRALERFTVGLMANGAVSGLVTAAN